MAAVAHAACSGDVPFAETSSVDAPAASSNPLGGPRGTPGVKANCCSCSVGGTPKERGGGLRIPWRGRRASRRGGARDPSLDRCPAAVLTAMDMDAHATHAVRCSADDRPVAARAVKIEVCRRRARLNQQEDAEGGELAAAQKTLSCLGVFLGVLLLASASFFRLMVWIFLRFNEASIDFEYGMRIARQHNLSLQ